MHRSQERPSRRLYVPCECECSTAYGDGGAGEPSPGDGLNLDLLCMYRLGRQDSADPVMVDVEVNGKPVRMEVDTGAAVSVMSQSSYERIRGE